MGTCQPVGHIDAHVTLARSPHGNVVIEGAVATTPVAAHERTAVHKHQNRAICRAAVRGKNIQ
jgi:hypothetical protein